MFPAICRSSSGAPTVFTASGLHTHVVIARSQVWVGTGLVVTARSQVWGWLVIATESYYDARIHEYKKKQN